MNLGMQGSDPNKIQILNMLRDFIFKHPKVGKITIIYSGHGVVGRFEEGKTKAGMCIVGKATNE